jgi:hypothetical protein
MAKYYAIGVAASTRIPPRRRAVAAALGTFRRTRGSDWH